MYSTRYAEKKDITKIASFIAQCNSNIKNHIGYCGTNEKDIYSCLESDQDLVLSFILMFDEDELVGLLGYDYYDNSAELWGPFISSTFDFQYIATILWDKAISKLPEETIIQGFPNKENNLCLELYKSKGMSFKGDNYVLEFSLDEIDPVKYNLLGEDDHNEFTSLHDSVFPNTYYSGKDIISMMDSDNVVIVSKSDIKLVGYAFVNIDASLDGNIEFIGVKSDNRRDGHGIKILNMALSWFKEKGTKKLVLCIDSKNEKAISLYKKTGFRIKYYLEYFAGLS